MGTSFGSSLQINDFNACLAEYGFSRLLFVHGKSFEKLALKEKLVIPCDYVEFTDFSPNPDYLDVMKGVELISIENCDAILAIGGGSAIDTAKAIKFYGEVDVPIIAIVTTAGSGSEATRFAVVYKDGVKQSLNDIRFIPEVVLFDSDSLATLSLYQKKVTLFDALGHAIESMWSVNSTEQSRRMSEEAISIIVKNYYEYIFENAKEKTTLFPDMMLAAHLAGEAINIAQTTAAHAMSYKLTKMYGISHGHAVMSCLPFVWKYMLIHKEKCIDPRGIEFMEIVFEQIAKALGQKTPQKAIEFLNKMYNDFGLNKPETDNSCDIKELVNSVNLTRLKNNPVELNEVALEEIYREIVTVK